MTSSMILIVENATNNSNSLPECHKFLIEYFALLSHRENIAKSAIKQGGYKDCDLNFQ